VRGRVRTLLEIYTCMRQFTRFSIGFGIAFLKRTHEENTTKSYRPRCIAARVSQPAFAWRRLYRPAPCSAPTGKKGPGQLDLSISD